MRTITLTARYMIVKAGLVSAASLALARLLGLSEPVTVVFASILCIPTAFYKGVKSGLRNIYATIIGAVVAVASILLLRDPHLAIPPGVMIVCAACYACRWLGYFPLAAYTFLVLSFSKPSEIWWDSLQRLLCIVVGIATALLVNYLVSLFRYGELYDSQFRQLFRNVENRFRQMAECFQAGDAARMRRLEFSFHLLFRQISAFIDEIADLKNEMTVRKVSGGLSYEAVVWLGRITGKLAAIAHYSWDIVSFSPDLLCANAMSPAVKRAMDEDIKAVEDRLREIFLVVNRPGERRRAGEKLSCAPSAAPPDALPMDEDDRLQLVSLRLSVQHLKSEVDELADIVQHFLAELSRIPAGSRMRRMCRG